MFHKPNVDHEGSSSNKVLEPGQQVSANLYDSPVRGRLPNTFGKEPEVHRFTGGGIFVNIATKFVFAQHLPKLTAAFAVKAKHALERYAETFGVEIKEYLTDNHPFSAKEFAHDCENQKQKHYMSGVGAKHQNRVERSMQTIFQWA
jgi:hypothetical protein